MSYKKIKSTMEIEAVDIPTMQNMTKEEYREYIEYGLTNIDHHGVLRSEPAGYPIACTPEQLLVYVEYLKGIKHKLGE